jgi:hypothetical protein
MGNNFTALKKFLSNKNTVTFLCVILGVIVLVVGYRWRVQSATNPVSIPYAKVAIDAKTKITAEMIDYTEVPQSLITTSKTIVTNASNIIGKYSTYASGIPKNSYFYSDVIMEEEEMPDYAFVNMADGYTVYSLKVNMNTTYANKIFPNTYIDLYAKATDATTGKIMFARLIESIKVKAVKDDKGNALLESGINNGTPSAMLFEVPDDLFDLLKKAEYVDGVEVIPVPRNSAYTASQGETTVDNATLKQYILNKCVDITS